MAQIVWLKVQIAWLKAQIAWRRIQITQKKQNKWRIKEAKSTARDTRVNVQRGTDQKDPARAQIQ